MKIFDDTEILRGGSYPNNLKWMSRQYVKSRVKAWIRKSCETGREQPDFDDENQWIPHQCMRCYWFGALDMDYGFCFNIESPNEGHICFEHGGCKFHSDLKKPSPLDMDKASGRRRC